MSKFVCLSDSLNEPCFLTHWSVGHFMFGVVSFFVFETFLNSENYAIIFSFILHLLYEYKDQCITHNNNSKLYKFQNKFYQKIYNLLGSKSNEPINMEDSLINSVGDQISATLGIFVAYFLKRKFNKIKKTYWIIGSIIIWIFSIIIIVNINIS